MCSCENIQYIKCMYVCIYICLYVRIYVHFHLCLCIYVSTYICSGKCTSMNKCIFSICMSIVCMHIYIYIQVQQYFLQYIYIHTYYTCVCIYIYICVCITYAYYVQICYRVGINIVRHHKTHPKIHAHSFWAHGNETNGVCDQTMWENHFIHYFVLESHRSHGLSLRLWSLLPKQWLKLTGNVKKSFIVLRAITRLSTAFVAAGKKDIHNQAFPIRFPRTRNKNCPNRRLYNLSIYIYILPKTPDKNIHKVFIPGPLRLSHKIVQEGPSRGSYKLSLQEPRNSVPEGPSHKHLKYRASSISFCKDLLEDFTRISTTSSHKGLYKILVKIFMYEDLCKCATRLWQDRYSTTFEF